MRAVPSSTPQLASENIAHGGVNITDQAQVAVTGDLFGGDKVVQIQAEQAYDVHGLPNPYLGLASFTYADRAKYAGRQTLIAETVRKITDPTAPYTLFFVTGASGSGKSSFVQAGLLPALIAHYPALTVNHAIFRPGPEPLRALADALWRQMGFPQLDTTALTAETFTQYLRANTPGSQINLVVIDQFEELFTQSVPSARDVFVQILTSLATFAATHTHIIATLRADYLPDLFGIPVLYALEKGGVQLRAMNVAELGNAIQQPLRAMYPDGEKRFQLELVEQLAQETALNAAYLSLLQVTLEEIWRKGTLTFGAYSNLTDAIQARANKVLAYLDYNAASPEQPRPQAEQNALLDLLLNLVDVAHDDDARRDVRRRRSKAALAQGSPDRLRLIDELAQARLLSLETQPTDTTQVNVDLIHDSLLANWDRLQTAIAERRLALRQRARFEQQFAEWVVQNRSDTYLLTGVRLAEARELDQRADIAVQGVAAKEFLQTSIAKMEAEQQRQLARERQRAEAEERARHEAEKRAASEKQRAHILRLAALGLSILLVVAAIASVLAWQATGVANQRTDMANWANATAQAEAIERGKEADRRATAEANALNERDRAEQEAQISASQRLATQSDLLRNDNPELSFLLGIEALKLNNNFDARNSLLTALMDARQIALFQGHAAHVQSVVFNPDGKMLASASKDTTIRLWDVASGKPIGQPLIGHTGRVYRVVFSPDGKLLVSGSEDKTIRLWDVASGKPIGQPLIGHNNIVSSVAFSPAGKILASGSCSISDEDANCKSGEIILWDVASRELLDEARTAHQGHVYSVAFSPDGKLLASGGLDATIRLWHVKSGKLIGDSFTLPTHSVSSVTFSPNGKMLASGGCHQLYLHSCGQGEIMLWDVASGKPIGQPLVGHTDLVWSVAFSPDGNMLVSGSVDATIRLWYVTSGKLIDNEFAGHTHTVSSVTFSPNGKILASGSCGESDGNGNCGRGDIRLWDVASGKLVGQPLIEHLGMVWSVAFSPNGKILASGSGDTIIRLWDAVSRKPLSQPLTGHTDVIWNVTFSPNGKMLASASWDATIRLWDAVSRKPLNQPLTGHTNAVLSVMFSPDGKMLASGGCREIDDDKNCTQGEIKLWDVVNGKPVGHSLIGHSDVVYSLAFSPDGKTLASGSCGERDSYGSCIHGEIRLWDVASGKPIGQPLTGHSDIVYSVRFSPDGKMLASGSGDKTIRLWDVTNKKLLIKPLTGHTNAVYTVAFSPDSKMLASGGLDKTIHLWNVDFESWKYRACLIANRNLTRSEWEQYVKIGSETFTDYAKHPTCPGLPVEQ